MCGIVGYIGHNQAIPFLINGLEKFNFAELNKKLINLTQELGILKTIVNGKNNNDNKK